MQAGLIYHLLYNILLLSTSEGLLRRLATLRKRKQKAGATEEAKTEEKLRGKEQKQRDLDESEREAKQSHVC